MVGLFTSMKTANPYVERIHLTFYLCCKNNHVNKNWQLIELKDINVMLFAEELHAAYMLVKRTLVNYIYQKAKLWASLYSAWSFLCPIISTGGFSTVLCSILYIMGRLYLSPIGKQLCIEEGSRCASNNRSSKLSGGKFAVHFSKQ